MFILLIICLIICGFALKQGINHIKRRKATGANPRSTLSDEQYRSLKRMYWLLFPIWDRSIYKARGRIWIERIEGYGANGRMVNDVWMFKGMYLHFRQRWAYLIRPNNSNDIVYVIYRGKVFLLEINGTKVSEIDVAKKAIYSNDASAEKALDVKVLSRRKATVQELRQNRSYIANFSVICLLVFCFALHKVMSPELSWIITAAVTFFSLLYSVRYWLCKQAKVLLLKGSLTYDDLEEKNRRLMLGKLHVKSADAWRNRCENNGKDITAHVLFKGGFLTSNDLLHIEGEKPLELKDRLNQASFFEYAYMGFSMFVGLGICFILTNLMDDNAPVDQFISASLHHNCSVIDKNQPIHTELKRWHCFLFADDKQLYPITTEGFAGLRKNRWQRSFWGWLDSPISTQFAIEDEYSALRQFYNSIHDVGGKESREKVNTQYIRRGCEKFGIAGCENIVWRTQKRYDISELIEESEKFQSVKREYFSQFSDYENTVQSQASYIFTVESHFRGMGRYVSPSTTVQEKIQQLREPLTQNMFYVSDIRENPEIKQKHYFLKTVYPKYRIRDVAFGLSFLFLFLMMIVQVSKVLNELRVKKCK